jgi:hypothetical protein
MESAATTTTSASTAETTGTAHAGESVIALHACRTSVLDTAKGTMPSGRRSRGETAFGASAFSAASFGATAFGPTNALIAAESGGATKSGRASEPVSYSTVGIRHAHPMSRIVSPHAAQAAMEIVKSIAMEKIAVQENPAPEPIGTPAPSKAAPQPPPAPKVKAKIDAREK